MLLERTSVPYRSHSRTIRARPRSFRAWSGMSLSRYFDKSDQPEHHQPDALSGHKPLDPCSEEEMSKRREQLQELLQRVDLERVSRKKTG